MSLTEGLRKGMVIRHDGHLYTIEDFYVAHTGRQKPTVHLRLRTLVGGILADRSLDQLGAVEEVPTEMRQMQYLYAAKSDRVFMDLQTFEQYPLSEEVLGAVAPFLIPEDTYALLTVDGQPVSLQLPPAVVMEVVDTAPPQHGGGGNVYKEAKLNAGFSVQVPLFIKNGDKVRIRTDNREYLGKEQ